MSTFQNNHAVEEGGCDEHTAQYILGVDRWGTITWNFFMTKEAMEKYWDSLYSSVCVFKRKSTGKFAAYPCKQYEVMLSGGIKRISTQFHNDFEKFI